MKKLLIGCGGVGLCFLFFIISIICLMFYSESKEFIVPGHREITLDHSGEHEIFYNFHSSEFEGHAYHTPQDFPDKLQIKLFDQAGKPIVWHRIKTLNFKDSSGNIKVGNFSVDKPGKVTIESSGIEEKRLFSISKSIDNWISIIVWTFAGMVFVVVFIPTFFTLRS